MNETNLNWDDLRLFLAVARAGGLAGAIESTQKSAPTLGRRMLALESDVGCELFKRHAKGYELTKAGLTLFSKVVALEEEIGALSYTKGQNAHTTVKISAGRWMTHMLCQHIHLFKFGQSGPRLAFLSADEVLNISRGEATIGIRNHRPTQQHLVCRKIAPVTFAEYATSKSKTKWIHVLADTPSARWLDNKEDVEYSVEVSSARIALELALKGAGRVVLPTFVGDRQARLSRLSKPITELTHNQWLVTHQGARHSSEIRSVLDTLYSVLKKIHRESDKR